MTIKLADLRYFRRSGSDDAQGGFQLDMEGGIVIRPAEKKLLDRPAEFRHRMLHQRHSRLDRDADSLRKCQQLEVPSRCHSVLGGAQQGYRYEVVLRHEDFARGIRRGEKASAQFREIRREIVETAFEDPIRPQDRPRRDALLVKGCEPSVEVGTAVCRSVPTTAAASGSTCCLRTVMSIPLQRKRSGAGSEIRI